MMSTLETHLKVVIDGYDLAAERDRYAFDDVRVLGHALNRGRATVSISPDAFDVERLDAAKREHGDRLFPTTLESLSPVLELGFPTAGHFVQCSGGVYFDAYLGVAQKLIDENHPAFRTMLGQLLELGLVLRREINTDDYLARCHESIRTPQDLAELLNTTVQRSFPNGGDYRTFLSNSGTEAIEAGFKLAQRVAHGKLIERYGRDTEAKLMEQLGIPRSAYFADRGETLYADYPFFAVSCHGGFHGRTLGSLQLTCSKTVHKEGYGTSRWVRHVPYNGSVEDLDALLDDRSLPEILDADGGVSAVIDAGRIPVDLFALFAAEGFQGEGGYHLGDAAWFRSIAERCSRADALLLVDEIQSFGRTGKPFMAEHLGVTPDVITLAKAAVVGATVARADLARYLPEGWHANTWGGGKVLDNQFAWTTIDTYLNYSDPLFDGRTYVENSKIKGEYLRSTLAWLQGRHPETVVDYSGLGCMFGLTVRRRDEVVAAGWRRGLKLLGCGPAGEESRLRILFLADVITHEVDEFARILDQVLSDVEEGVSADN